MNFLEKLTDDQVKELTNCIDTEDSLITIRRAQAILMVEDNASESLILQITKYEREVAVKIRKKYIKCGLQAIRSKQRIRKDKQLLTRQQKIEIIEILKTKKPSDFFSKAPDCWTARYLGDYIYDRYHVMYKSKKPLYLLFEEAKFSFHKPEKFSERRDEEAIKQWKKDKKAIILEELSIKTLLCSY